MMGWKLVVMVMQVDKLLRAPRAGEVDASPAPGVLLGQGANDGIDGLAVALQVLPIGDHRGVLADLVQPEEFLFRMIRSLLIDTTVRVKDANLSAATLSRVRLIRGYWSRTVLKWSTDREKRLQ